MDLTKLRAYLVSDMGYEPEDVAKSPDADILAAIRVETQTAGDSMLDEIGCSQFESREIRLIEKMSQGPISDLEDARVTSLNWVVTMWELLTGADALEILRARRALEKSSAPTIPEG